MSSNKKLQGVWRMLTLNPVWRVMRHIDYLSDHVAIADKVDKENFRILHENIKKTARRLRLYQFVRIVLLAMLYVSFIITIAQTISPWFNLVLGPLIALATIMGFGLLTILVLLLSRIIHVVEVDLLIEHSHLVAIAVKHNKNYVVHPTYKFGLFMVYEDE